MRRSRWIWGVMLCLAAGDGRSQTPAPVVGDQLGMHNFTVASGSSVTTPGSLGCTFCHAPHGGIGGVTPLWNQRLSSTTYTPYTSTTFNETGSGVPPVLGKASSLCLSCHDGTVGVGQTAAYGTVQVQGTMNPKDVLGTNLTGSHPFNLVLPIKDAPDLAASLVAQGVTADPTGAVKLVNGNIECTSCHDPHVQGIDAVAQNFLVRDSSNGQMCLACHDPNRVFTGAPNSLAGWSGSIHAVATNQVANTASAGLYPTVAVNSCSSCHMEHNPNSSARLLRPATPAAPGVDATTQACVTCHNGGSLVTPAAPNVYAEFAKVGAHLLPAGANGHDAVEPAVLNNNRHATCVDCHSAHASNAMGATFGVPPAVRPPQNGVSGVSAVDGATALTPAVNQYENCLRCHGTSIGKQTVASKYGYLPTRLVFAGDPLNIIPEFSTSATSSHPVVHDRNSPLPQPSLLTYMTNLNGTASGRLVSPRVFCTDCHNSDDNREFGGTGPAGPHGSVNAHILERNYQYSQAATPGTTIANLFPNPDLSPLGPYAMCAKCHDLTQIMANTSWTRHSQHINDGFSCSVCHTAHGIGALNGSVSGERLVNFDLNVVAPNGANPISYNRAANTCSLTCHNHAH